MGAKEFNIIYIQNVKAKSNNQFTAGQVVLILRQNAIIININLELSCRKLLLSHMTGWEKNGHLQDKSFGKRPLKLPYSFGLITNTSRPIVHLAVHRVRMHHGIGSVNIRKK